MTIVYGTCVTGMQMWFKIACNILIICNWICETRHNHLLSQVYPQAKFQPHIPISFGVTALQSSNNNKMDLYSQYRKNKLQALTKNKINGVDICTTMFTMSRGVKYWVHFSTFFTAYKDEICEQIPIMYNRFDMT